MKVDRLIVWWRHRTCKHVFRGIDMGHRDATGWLDWPCSKCAKVYRVEYGLQVPGQITGPWGEKEEPHNKIIEELEPNGESPSRMEG